MNTSFRESASSLSDAASAAQNELWEVDLSASSAFSTVSIPSSVQPKKKRIRRQKQELLYLRELVVNLEEQMSKLKVKQPPSIDDHDKAAIEGENSSEEKNHNLRSSLEGQLKLARKLEGLLHKRPRDEKASSLIPFDIKVTEKAMWRALAEEGIKKDRYFLDERLTTDNLERLLRKRPRDEEVAELAGYKRYKPLAVAPTDDEIFADQLAHVERAHLDANELFGGPEFANRAASFCDLQVTSDSGSDTGVAFVTKAYSMLPFDVHGVRGGRPSKMSYFNEERLATENLVARSYALDFNAGSFQSSVRGSRRPPIEINGVKLSGLRCNQVGWIVLRGVNLAPEDAQSGLIDTSKTMMSTSLQSYCKMTLELQEDIADQELQVGALTNLW
ncbi:hypothetical protein GQ600_26365 [Phytophthora cactorum]|nr:hypothetical protein GQ600_26365 [Phytophthora cactorum]